MAFNVSDWKATIQKNGSILRTNKFEVMFTPPPGLLFNVQLNGGINGVPRDMRMYACLASIPGVQVEKAAVRRFGYGPNEQKPFAPVYNDAQIRFILDGNGDVWNYLQAWHRFVLNYENKDGVHSAGPSGQLPYELNYKDDYVTDLKITSYNDVGDPAIVTVLRQAYPFIITDVQLSWSDKNQNAMVDVGFTYMDWYQDTSPPIQPFDVGAFNAS